MPSKAVALSLPCFTVKDLLLQPSNSRRIARSLTALVDA